MDRPRWAWWIVATALVLAVGACGAILFAVRIVVIGEATVLGERDAGR